MPCVAAPAFVVADDEGAVAEDTTRKGIRLSGSCRSILKKAIRRLWGPRRTSVSGTQRHTESPTPLHSTHTQYEWRFFKSSMLTSKLAVPSSSVVASVGCQRASFPPSTPPILPKSPRFNQPISSIPSQLDI